jgi:polyhydroxyalkanoate synthase
MHRGHFSLGGHEVSFGRIKSALLAFAGDTDVIATVASASAIMSVVGSMDKTFQVVPGGHAGVFTGSKAAHSTWSIAADWLELRSDLVEK